MDRKSDSSDANKYPTDVISKWESRVNLIQGINRIPPIESTSFFRGVDQKFLRSVTPVTVRSKSETIDLGYLLNSR